MYKNCHLSVKKLHVRANRSFVSVRVQAGSLFLHVAQKRHSVGHFNPPRVPQHGGRIKIMKLWFDENAAFLSDNVVYSSLKKDVFEKYQKKYTHLVPHNK